jgi:hypothetical protein
MKMIHRGTVVPQYNSEGLRSLGIWIRNGERAWAATGSRVWRGSGSLFQAFARLLANRWCANLNSCAVYAESWSVSANKSASGRVSGWFKELA